MQKSTLIQLVFIILGIAAIYNGASQILGLLYYLVSYNQNMYSDNLSFLVATSLVMCSGNLIIAFIMISRSGKWATIICKKSNLDGNFKLVTNPYQLFFVLFICMGLYRIVIAGADLLNLIFHAFADKIGNSGTVDRPNAGNQNWVNTLLNLLLPFLLIATADKLAAYFSKKIGPTEYDLFKFEETT